MTQPGARVETVRDTYFGTTIDDPYRWMEDRHSDEFETWLRGQAAYTRAYLDALSERTQLQERIDALSNAGAMVRDLKAAGECVFYLKREPGAELPRLVCRAVSKDEGERILFDPNTLSGEAHTAIDWYYPSRDGRLIAYGISQGGSESSVLHALDVEQGSALDLAIDRTYFSWVSWLADNRSFLYRRFPALAADASATDFYKDARVYLHRLGDDPATDRAVFGRGINPRVELARGDIPALLTEPGSDWVIARIEHGDRLEVTLYAAPINGLSDPAACPWQKIADIEDDVADHALAGDTIYLRTHRDAPRFKVIALALNQPDLTRAQVIVPESEAVITQILAVGDTLLTLDRLGGMAQMRRVNRETGAISSVALPFAGSIYDWTRDDKHEEVFFTMESWIVSPRIYRYNAGSGQVADSGWLAPWPIDFSEIEVHEVFAHAHDGTPIPLSIIHRKGLRRDGNNPTILTGYGSYGISSDPFFRPERMAWYERGGVVAVGHIRGGGEYGEDWHKAGRMLNKQNTIDDFIACAEYLIEQGYTRPGRLAGEGGSAGGIPTGGALVKRPDLWAVMVMHVPVTNSLRIELTENGSPNIEEFGSVTTEDGFKGLQITNSYGKVQNGVNYPAVLLTGGYNDPRVVVWQPAKMAARLQAATASG
ncbi:MAG: prolyl oligopeptidase family serine peptidase, partial [Ktedonobacteraceae bacterium]